MLKYILVRLFQLLFVLLVVSMLVFVLTSVLGNPLYLMVRENASQEEVEAAIKYMGLDKPLYQQYFQFMKNLLRGDFGKSYVYHQNALKLILERFPATMELVFVAMLLAAVIGIPLGVYAGARPKSMFSRLTMFLSIAGISLPSFWVGMIFIYFFGLKLMLFPVSGRGPLSTFLWFQTSLGNLQGIKHLILPAVTLALGNVATIIRLTKAGMQENMRQDFVKFARSKGVSDRNVFFGHALKNTLIPVITIFGLQLGSLIAFTTITESIFAWPGMGKLLIDAITAADRPIISAYLLFVAVMFVVINFVVDLLYTLVDPRIDLQ